MEQKAYHANFDDFRKWAQDREWFYFEGAETYLLNGTTDKGIRYSFITPSGKTIGIIVNDSNEIEMIF